LIHARKELAMPNPYSSRRRMVVRSTPVTTQPPRNLDSTQYQSPRPTLGRQALDPTIERGVDDAPTVPDGPVSGETAEIAAELAADDEPIRSQAGDEMPTLAPDLIEWINSPERAELAHAAEMERPKPRVTVLAKIDEMLGG
jgi:hypothetical protein